MPKFRYTPPPKVKSELKEEFFDFRDVQTRPWRWAMKTPSYLYEATAVEIYEAQIRKDRRERLREQNRLHR